MTPRVSIAFTDDEWGTIYGALGSKADDYADNAIDEPGDWYTERLDECERLRERINSARLRLLARSSRP